jgi:hypothetical protein
MLTFEMKYIDWKPDIVEVMITNTAKMFEKLAVIVIKNVGGQRSGEFRGKCRFEKSLPMRNK